MIRLVHAEFVKLRTTQVWFWLLLAALAISAIVVVASLAPANNVTDPSDVADMFTASNNASIVVFVLGVLGVTTEFRYQTITPTVLVTPSRWTLITAKLISYTLLGAIYALACLVIQLAMALPWLSAKGIDFSLDAQLRHVIGAVFIVVALYGVIGLGVGALLRNQIVAVTVGVIFLLALENLILLIPKVRNAWAYTPGGASNAILYTHGQNDFNGVHLLSSGAGVIVLLVWALIPALIGAGITMNRDIT
ncbi:MAG TPA: ABC transporter permease [Jatrophihabitantaceae bacterium]|jgi:hypothetical protein|nr:ABC transporter permease [Jatrophihabitantaceae bacterium]